MALDLFNDIVYLLERTIEPNNDQRSQAERMLDEMLNDNGFAYTLLQVVMDNSLSLAVRQAAAVHLKNLIYQCWRGETIDTFLCRYNREDTTGDPKYMFEVAERNRLRDVIVEAVIQAPDMIRVHLCLIHQFIIDYNFTSCWTKDVEKINTYLQDPFYCMAAVQCLHSLIKRFLLFTKETRVPLVEAMKSQLPIMLNIMISHQDNQSIESILLKKQVVKSHHAFIRHTLPLDLYTKEELTKWMEVLCFALSEPLPEHTLMVDEPDHMTLPWWKLKKWSIKTICKIFHGYVSTKYLRKEYIDFSKWYLVTFPGDILEVLHQILDQFRKNYYVSPRVLHHALDYIELCVLHSQTWKLLKPKMMEIIEEVVLPLLSFGDADQFLWDSPEPYCIRIKYDSIGYLSPITTAKRLLKTACMKRKGIVESTMALCKKVLNTPNYDPRRRNCALHVIGIVHTSLKEKPDYIEDMCTILEQLVFPEFDNPLGHMRARALWVIHSFGDICFKSDNLSIQTMQLSMNALLNDTELQVKVEASIAIKWLLSDQEKAQDFLKPQVKELIIRLLDVLKESANKEMVVVVQTVLKMCSVELQPMAGEITDHVITSICLNIASDASADEKKDTVRSLRTVLETIISAFEQYPEIRDEIEKKILCRIVSIIQNDEIFEYFEDVMSILRKLSANKISEDMWKVLPMLELVNKEDKYINFKDMLPILYNYMTVDAETFWEKSLNFRTIFVMIRDALSVDASIAVETQLYSAKLLELIVLNHTEDGNLEIVENTLNVVLKRLSVNVQNNKLRLMLMQVLIALFYTEPNNMINGVMKFRYYRVYLTFEEFFLDWIRASHEFEGIHSLRLSMLAMCRFLNMRFRPSLSAADSKVIPCCVTMLENLQPAYEEKGEGRSVPFCWGKESKDEELLSSDEEDFDDKSIDYMEKYKTVTRKLAEEDDVAMSEAAHRGQQYRTYDDPTECFKTPIESCETDVFIAFKNCVEAMEQKGTLFLQYKTPTAPDGLERWRNHQSKKLEAVLDYASRRKEQLSKKLEQPEGYN